MMPDMARAIVVEHNGVESRFGFSAVTRARLYGERKKVVVDEHGRPTLGGWLTTDGSLLLMPGGRAELYLDEAGDVVERADLVWLDADGKTSTRLEPTLDKAQRLRGPIAPERLLEYVTTSVYALEADALEPELAASLARGEIWETDFNYTAGFERQTLFLVQNPEGVFALVAELAPLEPATRASRPPEGDDPLSDDELDFAML